MNVYQELWWKQCQADYAVYELLRREGSAPCHQLHYLQMVTEKIAKAHLWQSGSSPPKSHVGFHHFIRYLSFKKRDSERIARIFYFARFEDFRSWIRTTLPIAYSLERIAPDLAMNGPNPEYPWPHEQPAAAPIQHDFVEWSELISARGRNLLGFIETAVRRFPEYADT
jgi:hypothetical protein